MFIAYYLEHPLLFLKLLSLHNISLILSNNDDYNDFLFTFFPSWWKHNDIKMVNTNSRIQIQLL